MAKGEGSEQRASRSATLLRSISEGVRTIVTVTERLNDLRTETVRLQTDLHRLAESVCRIAGQLDGVEKRFSEVDRRIELAVKLAVREELDSREPIAGPQSKSNEIGEASTREVSQGVQRRGNRQNRSKP